MGFRTTMTTADIGLKFPNWFIEKYPHVNFRENGIEKNTPLSLKWEIKFYDSFEKTDLFKDIQDVMKEYKCKFPLDIVLLHECGGITKVVIHLDKIIGLEPVGWKGVDDVEHFYCQGC